MAKALKQYAEFYGLDQLIAAKLPPPLEETDLTIVRLRDKLHCTYETAQKYLRQWEQDGNVEYLGKRLSHGKPQDAWRIKDL